MHPARLPTKSAPGEQWVYGMCFGGALDGEIRDIPAQMIPGNIVRWNEGRYMVGFNINGHNIRYLAWAGD